MRARHGRLRLLTTKYFDFTSRDEYRRIIASDLVCWNTQHKHTELFICADRLLDSLALETVIKLRSEIDGYIKHHPEFAESYKPVEPKHNAPKIAVEMCVAAKAAEVGPMAAVAGAFAAYTGRALLKETRQCIIENGGDVYIKTDAPKTVAVYAGKSPLSMKIGITLDSSAAPLSICTSAGTVGHSVSFGNADAAVVVSYDGCLADACATRLGNEIKTADDISRALEMIISIKGVIGAAAVVGGSFGAAGNICLQQL